MTVRFLFLILLLTALNGCARWEKEKPIVGLKFPVGRMTSDSVAFEVAVFQLDDSQTDSFEEFWSLLDQQKLDLPVRQRMDQNGLRVAVMASHAPAQLNRLIEPRPVELETLDVVQQQLAAKNKLPRQPRSIVHRRITNHDGETYPIQTSEIHPQLGWTIRNGDLQSVGAGELVRGMFEIMTLPQGNGTVRLRITPQIHHGKIRPTIGVAERDFIFDSSQTINRLTDLTLDVSLRAGETLIIAPTSDVQDLGQLFFGLPIVEGETNTHHLTHRMLLIRIVQTQLDDLFGNSVSQERLTTTTRQ